MKITSNIDKIGILGVFITVLFSPCCFPLFAFVASALGLGSYELFGEWTMYIMQLMVLTSIVGLILSYRKHNCLYPLSVAFPSALLIFAGFYVIADEYWVYLIYFGMIGLFIATLWNYRRNKLHNNIILESTLTCPNCGYKKTEIMPTDSCVYFYDCENCKQVLKPNKGDCCVYCSFGSIACPPIQAGKSCC